MKEFTINACSGGSCWEYDVNCPPGWYGSGCYDVEHFLYQEATFYVNAKTLEKALQLIDEKFKSYQGCGYSYTVHAVFYNPDSVKEKEAEDGVDTEEVYEWEYETPVEDDVPDEYKCEIG